MTVDDGMAELNRLIYDLLDYKREEDSVYIARKLLTIKDAFLFEEGGDA